MHPCGWGNEAVIHDDPEVLAMWREAMKGEEGGNKRANTNDNVIGDKAKQGNSRAYTLSRLQRESPELFERVKAGELSANKAAIEAGFRKVATVLDLLRKAWAKASKDERNKPRLSPRLAKSS